MLRVGRATVAACSQAAGNSSAFIGAGPAALTEAVRLAREIGRLEQLILEPCRGAAAAVSGGGRGGGVEGKPAALARSNGRMLFELGKAW